jgi:hypothetical protein
MLGTPPLERHRPCTVIASGSEAISGAEGIASSLQGGALRLGSGET